MIHGTINIR